jgi:hypothetical protein
VATPIYPSQRFDDLTVSSETVGTFWTERYAGRDLVLDYLRGTVFAERQLDQLAGELFASMGAATCPIFHRDLWHYLLLSEAEGFAADYLLYGGGGFYGPQPGTGIVYDYGVPIDTSWRFTVTGDLVSCALIQDALVNPTVSLTSGIDFYVTENEITFLINPFKDPRFVPFVDTDGLTKLRLYCFGADLDWNYLQSLYGDIVGFGGTSSGNYALALGALLDAAAAGSSVQSVALFLGAFYDVPVALSTETVTAVSADRQGGLLVTDQHVYRFVLTTNVMTNIGTTVQRGTSFTDALQLYEINRSGLPTALTELTVPPDVLDPGITGPLTFVNAEVPLTVQTNVDGFTMVAWPLGGASADVTAFFAIMHQKGVAAGKTMANYLDLRTNPTGQPTAANLPATVNPLALLVNNLFRYQAAFALVRSEVFGPKRLLGNLTSWLRKLISPHTELFVQELPVTTTTTLAPTTPPPTTTTTAAPTTTTTAAPTTTTTTAAPTTTTTTSTSTTTGTTTTTTAGPTTTTTTGTGTTGTTTTTTTTTTTGTTTTTTTTTTTSTTTTTTTTTSTTTTSTTTPAPTTTTSTTSTTTTSTTTTSTTTTSTTTTSTTTTSTTTPAPTTTTSTTTTSTTTTMSPSGTTYYVDSAVGNDAHAGTSPATAWQTIQHVNGRSLLAGDRVLFQGGQTFTDHTLIIKSTWTGTAANPITFGSYGSGRATINIPNAIGVSAQTGSQGYLIRDLIFIGPGNTALGPNGVVLAGSSTVTPRAEYAELLNLDVSNYGAFGVIAKDSVNNVKGGFNNLRMTMVYSHDNRDTGIQIQGTVNGDQSTYSHTNVYVGYCWSYNNKGYNTGGNSAGNGIYLNDILTGTIEYNLTFSNGLSCVPATTGGGPYGNWGTDCNGVTWQFNESHHNGDGGPQDGGGLDLDWGCQNCIMQYNYSHDNLGAGYLVAQTAAAPRYWLNNVYRYNISENDGIGQDVSGGGQAGITITNSSAVASRVTNGYFYGNTIFSSISACFVSNQTQTNMIMFNNIFMCTKTGHWAIEIGNSAKPSLTFNGNDYWCGGRPPIEWGGPATLYTLAQLQAHGQEKYAGNPTGRDIDPQLTNPGGGGTINDPVHMATLLTAYQLAGSNMIGAGIDPMVLFSINPGPQDFYGNTLPSGALSIGADQV